MKREMSAEDQAKMVLFIEALRGGKFSQGSGNLFTSEPDLYCCLGVACSIFHKKPNLSVPENLTLIENIDEGEDLFSEGYYSKEDFDMPSVFYDYAFQLKMACLNDGTSLNTLFGQYSVKERFFGKEASSYIKGKAKQTGLLQTVQLSFSEIADVIEIMFIKKDKV